MASDALTVSVPACQVKDSYVTYQIHITKGETSWFVRRRFADFEKLHMVIKRALPLEMTPELPPKKLRLGASKFAPDFVESRRVGLESYLLHLVAVVEPERVEALDDFLEYAEHCLERAISLLGGVTELTHVVRMLKSAADRAAAVHSKSVGGTTTAAAAGGASNAAPRPAPGSAARRRSDAGSDDEEDDASSGQRAGTTTASVSVPAGGELLPTLREVVRMMSEYGVILRGACDDTEERCDATAASNTYLSSRLHAKEEETVDLKQLMAALREKRRAECDRERAALLLAAAQSRTVVAELRRVLREQSLYRASAQSHRSSSARLRVDDSALGAWERGVLAPAYVDAPASTESPGGSDLQAQAGSLAGVAEAAARLHDDITPYVNCGSGSSRRKSDGIGAADDARSGPAAAWKLHAPPPPRTAAAAAVGSGDVDNDGMPLSPPDTHVNFANGGGDGDSDDNRRGAASLLPLFTATADGLSVLSAGALCNGGNLAVVVALSSAAAENAHLARLLQKLHSREFVRKPRPAAVATAAAASASAYLNQPQGARAAQQQPASALKSVGSSSRYITGAAAAVGDDYGMYSAAASPSALAAAVPAPGTASRGGLNPHFKALSSSSVTQSVQQQQQQYNTAAANGRGVAAPAASGAAGLRGRAGSLTGNNNNTNSSSASQSGSAGTPYTAGDSFEENSSPGMHESGAAPHHFTGTPVAPPASAAAAMMRAKLAAASGAGGAGDASAGNPFGSKGRPPVVGNPFGGGGGGPAPPSAAAGAGSSSAGIGPTTPGGRGGAAVGGGPRGGPTPKASNPF